MRHQRFLEPISPTDACGPDLDEIGDDEYLNYFLPAEDRLPPSFYDQREQKLFDRTTLDMKAELKSIDSLLERSRDLRLLSLEARFQAFAGSIVGVADCIVAMTELVSRYWDDVHPKPLDPEDPVRQNLIGGVDDRSKIVLPLHYATIVRDKRLGPVTWRQYSIATGAIEKREDETSPDLGDIRAALSSDENAPQATAVHEALVKSLDAMTVVRAMFQEKVGFETAPNFGGLRELFVDMRKLIETSRPELGSGTADAGADEPQPGEGEAGEVADGAGGVITIRTSPGAVLISTHREANAALEAVETYFRTYEPSAPALILVHQARMLVGKSLVEALDMLLPDSAERAAIALSADARFQLNMPLMRNLAQEISTEVGQGDDEPANSFDTGTRPGVTALISGIEDFYKRAEPSSPIPMLLGKARSFLNRDFAMILNDLIAKEEAAY